MKTFAKLRPFVLAAAGAMLSAGCFAQSFSDAVVSTKKGLIKEFSKTELPVATGVLRYGATEKISANVKGLDKLVLTAWGTPDGPSSDHAVWGNARLTAADGTVTYLDQLPFESDKVGWGRRSLRNVNFSGKKISIGDNTYEHGVLAHCESEIIVKLDKKYVRFEAEVGLDNGASRSQSSAMFCVSDRCVPEYTKALASKYKGEISALMQTLTVYPTTWLTQINPDIERATAKELVAKLKNPAAFNKMIASVAGTPEQQTLALLNIIADAGKVLDIQNGLSWIKIDNVRKAYGDFSKTKGYDVAKYALKMSELEKIFAGDVNKMYTNDAAAVTAAANAVKLSREILLSNPALDGDKIIIGRYNVGGGARTVMTPSLGTQPNNWSNQTSASRTGFDAEISELSNLRGDINSRTIYKPKSSGPVTDLMLHWNGDKVLFTSTNENNRLNVFEVGLDGSNPRQVVNLKDAAPDLEFFDGTYLPDGRFIVNSNVGYQGVPCVNGSDAVGNMTMYDPKTGEIRRLTFDQDANWHPVVMINGRVMYVRWEYTDLTHYFSRIVMHMNPDGTEVKSLYGSGGFFPNSTFDTQPIPGATSRFVGVISGHHGVARSGRLMIFDPQKSRKEEKGIIQEIPYAGRPIDPIIKDELVNDVWPQFIKPCPLNDKYFLVSAKLTPESLWGIYLVDIYDNVTLIAENEGEGLISPVVVNKRPVPPVIPDRVNLKDTTSTIFIQDIYEGEGLPGVKRGTVKEIRVFAYEYAYNRSLSDHVAQGIQSGWDIKRLIGTVPVEEDGSAIFKVPANMPISLQPLDSEGRAIQWMRSWITGMPGETISCVGCHEDHNKLPMPKRVAASARSPRQIDITDGGIHPVTFRTDMQPVLERACVACHDGVKATPNFKDTTSISVTDWAGTRYYAKNYIAFHPYVSRQGPEADAYVMKPYEYHASTSEIVRMLKEGHHGVKLTDAEWRKLYTWIDLNAPYHGRLTHDKLKDIDQYQRRRELSKKYNNVDIDWQKEIADYTAYLKGKGAITPEMPAPVKEPSYKEVKIKNWPISSEEVAAMQTALGETRKEIEIAPGVKIVLRQVPAGEFVMGNNRYGRQCAPESKVAIDKPFWIGEIEITNAQYKALVPEHDSRYYAQQWKDHTGPGYPANKPEQPAIRISWNQAMEYCKKLSEKTGLNITLPTEAQWEWACRAGSKDDFWFGNSNSDFGAYDNLADAQLNKMAVSGVNPQPMPKDDSWYKLQAYLPKIESVDDGSMLGDKVGKYKSNAWGLYDMHGNVAEWTSSDYVPYPYNAKKKPVAEEKVVRGGSYLDRPKSATTYYRRGFLPWQPANTVGFRIVATE